MRRALSLLVVLMMTLGPSAQGVDTGDGSKLVSPDVMDGKMPSVEPPPDAAVLLSNIDGFFTENKGQKGEGAGLFYCQGSPLSVALGEGWVAFDYRPEGLEQGAMFRVSFEGANMVAPIGLDQLSHKNNYFIGNDPDKWITGVHNYYEIEYTSLYDGIDCRFYFGDQGLKYDLLIGPGADPGAVLLSFEGIEGLEIDDSSGDLEIKTSVGSVVDKAPYSFQDTTSGRSEVPTSYLISEDLTVGFKVGEYEPDFPLVIDPELFFSSYLGGDSLDVSRPPAIDDNGNIYLHGYTGSQDFPTTAGAYDTNKDAGSNTFVVKMSSDGSSLIFATYLGGSESESPRKVIIDSLGNPIVVGNTRSDDFPVTNNAYQKSLKGIMDCYLTKLNASGDRLIFSTYFGGNSGERPQGVSLSKTDEIYVSGYTASSDLPVVDGCYDTQMVSGGDLFIFKFNSNASEVLRGTYLGADGSADFPEIILDEDSLYVVGLATGGDNMPTTVGAYDTTFNGGIDVFALKMDENLTRVEWCTYIGGSEDDWNPVFILDADKNLVIGTGSYSDDFPTTIGAYDTTHNSDADVTITKLNKSGDRLIFSTYFGGNKSEACQGLTQDDEGNLLITGYSQSDDYPLTPDAFQDTKDYRDAIFTIMDANCSKLKYSTFIGGKGEGTGHDEFEGIAWCSPFAVMAGNTHCDNYPTTEGAFSTKSNGGSDAIVASFLIGTLNGTAPSEPLNLTAAPGDGSVTISWDPPADPGGLIISAYEIYSGPTKDDLNVIRRSFFEDRTFTHKNLMNGMEYFYGIKAANWVGESNISTIVNATPVGAPHSPLNLQATPSCASINLTWEPPWRTGGLPLLGYHLYRGTGNDDPEFLTNTGLTTEFVDEPLVNGETYSYYVRAYNAVGNGSRSNSVSATPIGPPTEPRSLIITEGDSQLTLQWLRPRADGGKSVIGYYLFRGTTENALEKVLEVEAHLTSHTDTHLTNGVEYHYAVQAYNKVGASPLSSTVSGTPKGRPGVPINVALKAGDGQITISWEPPEIDGGSPVQGYEVFRGIKESDLISISKIGPDTTSYTDTGLMNGQTFYYSVCAITMVGFGPHAAVLSAIPITLPDAPGDLLVQADDRMVTVVWSRSPSNGGAEIINYRIHRGTSEHALELIHNTNNRTFEYDDEDVEAGTEYFYAVSAYTTAGEGPLSIIASATPFGPPGIPIGLSANPGNREVRLSWSAPEDDGSSTIVGFVILRGTSDASLLEIAQLGDVNAYLDTSVTNGETYWYAIAAINEAGPGEYTEPIAATPEKPITPPGKVLTLVADTKGAKVTLQWNAPQDDGGSLVTGYVVYRGDSTGSMEVVATLGLVKTWTDEDVVRSNTYYYSVAALNDVGEGEAFTAYEVKVPKEKEDSPGFEVAFVALALLLVIPISRRRG